MVKRLNVTACAPSFSTACAAPSHGRSISKRTQTPLGLMTFMPWTRFTAVARNSSGLPRKSVKNCSTKNNLPNVSQETVIHALAKKLVWEAASVLTISTWMISRITVRGFGTVSTQELRLLGSKICSIVSPSLEVVLRETSYLRPHFRDRDPIGDTVADERPRSVLAYVDNRAPVDRVARSWANLQF